MQDRPYERGYFMSQEDEDAKKWQMFEQYKKLSARRATVDAQVVNAVGQAKSFVQAVERNPSSLEFFAVDNFPERKDLQELRQEMALLSQQINALKASLSQVGLNVDKP
jgi:hypothetical protein